jgi:endo-1,4-beta-xylanase
VAAAPTDNQGRNALITREFNALSAEGETIWRVIHPGPDTWDFAAADAFFDFAGENGLFTTATHFVWDQAVEFSGTPAWVREITDPDQLREAMRLHLRALTARYSAGIGRWIVVNEPLVYFGNTLYENHFRQVLGPGYISEAFRIAAEEAPASERWINEIFLESNPGRAEAYVELVAGLVREGVPVDGAGIQGHLFPDEPDFELLEKTLRELTGLGIKVSITELDAPVDPGPDQLALQAERMSQAVEACLKVPNCNGVTVWGLDDGQSWLNWLLGPNLAPVLFDADLGPKPSYYSVRAALQAGRQ